MSIINKIVFRGLKASRLKNSFVIITIMLAVCMMMVGLYFAGDVQRKDNDIANRYQASFLNMTNNQIQQLRIIHL